MEEFAPGLWRGPKPDHETLYDKNFKTIINLETETRELILNTADDELIDCINHSIRLFNFAFSGWLPPRAKSVAWVLFLLKDIGAKDAPRPVYLHCRHGHERTGFIVAVYRMRVMGWTFNEAYDGWRARGCHWLWWRMWKSELRKWEEK